MNTSRSIRRQRGVTLVETLVTLVSTSVGLLGVAALHLVSLRSNHESHLRLQASTLATSILERIRADRESYLAGEYARVNFNETGVDGTPSSANLSAWQLEIDRQLPGGRTAAAGAITRDESTRTVTITLRWSENNRTDEPTSYATLSMRTEI